MKRFAPLLVLLLLLLAGCGSPGQKILTAHNAYQQANDKVALALDLGLLSSDEGAMAVQASEAANLELKAATDAYVAGRPLDARFALERFDAALDRVLILYFTAQKRQEASHE